MSAPAGEISLSAIKDDAGFGKPSIGSPRDGRRLLVISYHFPPDGSVGGLRWAGLSKHLARRGWEVHVVTASPPAAGATEPNVHMHRCARGPTLNDAYKSWALGRAAGSTGSAAPPSSNGALTRTGPVRWLRENVSSGMVFPDYSRGWILRAAGLARGLMRRKHFDAVVTSGPPHGAHLAGTLACIGRPEKLTVDMRDPWAALIEKDWARTVFDSALMRFFVPRVERLVLRRAGAVVTNAPEFAESLGRAYPDLRISCVRNGIDAERLPPRAARKFDDVTLSYVGSLYAGRSLSPVLRAMREFFDERPDAAASVKLRIAGSMDAAHEARFRADVRDNRLADAVIVMGAVPSDQALDVTNRSHLTIVLAQDQPMQIPAKLYEGVCLGVPTLVITEDNSAAAREATRIGATAVEPTDVSRIKAVLERLWLDDDSTPVPIPATVNYASVAEQMEGVLLGGVARG